MNYLTLSDLGGSIITIIVIVVGGAVVFVVSDNVTYYKKSRFSNDIGPEMKTPGNINRRKQTILMKTI